MEYQDLKFSLQSLKRIINGERKVMDKLNLFCPICNSKMIRCDSYALKFEEVFFSNVPYYCKGCQKKGNDYPIFNVIWRSEESRSLWYVLLFLILILFGMSI